MTVVHLQSGMAKSRTPHAACMLWLMCQIPNTNRHATDLAAVLGQLHLNELLQACIDEYTNQYGQCDLCQTLLLVTSLLRQPSTTNPKEHATHQPFYQGN